LAKTGQSRPGRQGGRAGRAGTLGLPRGFPYRPGHLRAAQWTVALRATSAAALSGRRAVVPPLKACPDAPAATPAACRWAVSPMRIPGGRGREAPHVMAAARRRKPEGEGPEGAHAAFAAGKPSFDAGSPCPRRRGTGIGYKMARQTGIRASGRDGRVRIFCLVLSLMAHNARTMMRPRRRARGDSRRIPRAASRMLLVLEPAACTASGHGGGRRASHPPRWGGGRTPTFGKCGGGPGHGFRTARARPGRKG